VVEFDHFFYLVEMGGTAPPSCSSYPKGTTRLGQHLLMFRTSQFPSFIVVRFTEN